MLGVFAEFDAAAMLAQGATSASGQLNPTAVGASQGHALRL
jgi:hypothetical protein